MINKEIEKLGKRLGLAITIGIWVLVVFPLLFGLYLTVGRLL